MAPSITRKELLTIMFDSVQSVSKVEMQEVTMGPGTKAPLHLHPCPTMGIVTEGTIAFQIENQPVKYLNSGDAFYEPANVRIAKFNNESNFPAKFTVFYLLSEANQETVRILDK